MRQFFVSLVGAATCFSCVSYIQQYVEFGKSPVWPDAVPAEVGDVVAFEVRPPVPIGSTWSLECRGRVRFVEEPTSSSLDWTASPHAIRLETVVSPWDPEPPSQESSRGWLSYSMRDEGETNRLDRSLPLRRTAYRELAPVTFSAAFAPGKKAPELSVGESGGRVVVKYRTETDDGVAQAPLIDAMLLEEGKRTILYAEVRTNFGTVPKEPIGYEVSLSYDKSRVEGPVEVIVAGWIGHGDYWKPFTVTRYPAGATVGARAPAAPLASKL